MSAIRRAGLLMALVALVGILAACTATDPRLEDEFDPDSSTPVATRHDSAVITSGTDVTLPADQSVDLFVVYNGTARIEGQASSIVVVNGTANLVGARADRVVAIQSQVSIDATSVVAGDVRTIESGVTGATATTVAGGVRNFGPDMFFGWGNVLGWGNLLGAMALFYVAFAVSALMAGVVLAGLAGRQVRAAGALITKEPLMVVGAGLLGLIAIVTVGILAIVTVVGIPFGIGLLALVLPALFVIGYIVTGVWFGELILAQSSPAARERPYLAAVVGLTIVGLFGFIPPIGGLVSFVGFGAVMLLSWRVLRGARGAAPYAASVGHVAEAAS
jgi:hypothetical protein